MFTFLRVLRGTGKVFDKRFIPPALSLTWKGVDPCLLQGSIRTSRAVLAWNSKLLLGTRHSRLELLELNTRTRAFARALNERANK